MLTIIILTKFVCDDPYNNIRIGKVTFMHDKTWLPVYLTTSHATISPYNICDIILPPSGHLYVHE